MNRYPASLRPQEAVDPAAAPGAAPMPVRPRRPMFIRGPRGGPAPAPVPTESVGGSDEESNTELVLYGIVSLYERYPPRKAAGETPGPGVPPPPAGAVPPAVGAPPKP